MGVESKREAKLLRRNENESAHLSRARVGSHVHASEVIIRVFRAKLSESGGEYRRVRTEFDRRYARTAAAATQPRRWQASATNPPTYGSIGKGRGHRRER